MPPKPQPRNISEIKGYSRGKARNIVTPDPVSRVPTCPKHLGKDAKKFWHQIVPKITQMGILTEVDIVTLEQLCEIYGQWYRAKEVLNKEGDTYVNDKGDVKARPEVGIVKTCTDHIIRLSGKFGLTPYDRNSIQIKEPDTGDTKKSRHFD